MLEGIRVTERVDEVLRLLKQSCDGEAPHRDYLHRSTVLDRCLAASCRPAPIFEACYLVTYGS